MNDSARNLLFGLLAFQNNFIDRRALLAAFDTWTSDKSRPLGRILADRGAISEEFLALIDGLVSAHLSQHDNQPEKSLAALTTIGSVREDLKALGDSEVRASLAWLTAYQSEDNDPYATKAPSVGSPTTAGVRFRILRPLNKGGMGVVSVALDTELDRSIALKEIRETAADDRDYRARFLAEAEITGKLEHPGIIPIYGLGTYADGRPFYAMRLIRGDKTGTLMEAIERFYRDPNPAGRVVEFRGLLGRFLDVCNALSYAHSKGVLHRDLKPDNILLGPYGETLVVDWGLAKAAGRADPVVSADGDRVRLNLSGSELSPTLSGRMMGTPEYAPPEQMTGDLPNIGPRSDVYGLGAILYCLMTGKAPFSRKGIDLGELIARIESGDFPPPRQVRPDIDKPLEAICLKAMSRRPSGRYDSALALAADVERYLADEPVTAYREPWMARARRWTKKHRTAVASATAMLVAALMALTVGLIVVGGLNRKLDRARTLAEEQLYLRGVALTGRELALREARASASRAAIATAEAKSESAKVVGVINLLVNTFRSSDPIAVAGLGLRTGSEDGRKLTAIEILDRSAKSVTEGLSDQPLVQATLMDNIGDVYRSMYALDKAGPLLESALAIRTRHLDRSSLDVATSLLHLGCLHMDNGKFDESEALLQESLAIRSRLDKPDGLEACEVRFYLGLMHLFENNPQAEDDYRALVEARLRLLPDDHRDVALARIGLACALMQNQRVVEGLVQGQRALRHLFNKADGERIIVAIGNFQKAYALFHVLHQYGPAERLYNEGLEITRATLGKDNPYNGFLLYELGSLKEAQKRYPEAEANYREGLKLMRNSTGLRHPKALGAVKILADLLKRTGQYEEGKRLFDELIVARKLAYGPDHPWLADCLVDLSYYMRDGKDRPEARRLALQAVGIYRKNRGDRFRTNLAVGLNNLADLLNGDKEYKQAEPLLREALPLTRKQYGAKDRNVGIVLTNLASSLLAQGRVDADVEAVVDEARAILCSSFTPDDFHVGAMSDSLTLKLRQGHLDQAESFGLSAVKAAAIAFRDDPGEQAFHVKRLGNVLAAKGDLEQARVRFQEVLVLARRSAAPLQDNLAAYESKLARLGALTGDDPGHRETIARLWTEAIEADPKLSDDRKAQHRYKAACAAAMAGSSQGKDDPKPDEAGKAKLRAQAMGWLRAELAAWEKVATTVGPGNKELVGRTLAHWKGNSDLAGIRDAQELAKLPEAERKEWQALWGEVDGLLAKVGKP
ncbi:MAG: hypothetical protein JWN86_2980 [Planctomycetota bacterium]|nr:hypothetical protein [Planctomycetota bacterium]